MSIKSIEGFNGGSFIQYLLIILVVAGGGYLAYKDITLSKTVKENQEAIAQNNQNLSQKVSDIETILLATQEQGTTLAEALAEAQQRSDSLSEQFDEVNENVDTLAKITNTDKELLQKYSKVFFLNENYAPADLKTIPEQYTYDKDRTYKIHAEVYPYLIDMLQDAEDDGIDLQVISAFRSFGEQAILKGAYTVAYGVGTANQFSADQGYSEHQLGTAIDFTNDTVGATFSGFSKTETYKWLLDNAYKYGFVLSYPENNQYYQFEPWHWRFVGEKLAKDLHRSDKYFYDLTQREIDNYIQYLFD